jgi:hypothetical protein
LLYWDKEKGRTVDSDTSKNIELHDRLACPPSVFVKGNMDVEPTLAGAAGVAFSPVSVLCRFACVYSANIRCLKRGMENEKGPPGTPSAASGLTHKENGEKISCDN